MLSMCTYEVDACLQMSQKWKEQLVQKQHLSLGFFRFLCLRASGSAEGACSGSGFTLGWGASEALLLLLLAGGSSHLGHSAAAGRAALASISAAKSGA